MANILTMKRKATSPGSVYLAGSSLDIERVRIWLARLSDNAIRVASTWVDNVSAVGSANPSSGPAAANRLGWARNCLAEIHGSSVLWFLVPDEFRPTRGAWVELGYAYSIAKPIVCSGPDVRSSIFGALGTEYSDDAEALSHVSHIAKGYRL